MELLVAVDHNQLLTKASETVDAIDWSHPLSSLAVPPELHVLHGVNVGYKLQDLLQQPGREHASLDIPGHRTTCAATEGISTIYSIIPFKTSIILDNLDLFSE